MEKAIDLRIVKKALITLGFIAASILLPQIFHVFGLNGQKFLPMHIPVLLAGLLLGPSYGLVAGMISPLVSTALTGMPAEFPMMPIMVFELGTYGLISGILSKYTKLPKAVSLIIAMLAGRVSYFIAYEIIKVAFLPTIGANISVWGAVITGIPGIIIQLIIINLVMLILRRKKEGLEEGLHE